MAVSAMVLYSQALSGWKTLDMKCFTDYYQEVLTSLMSHDDVGDYLPLVKKEKCVETWYADTGAPFHMTDSLGL